MQNGMMMTMVVLIMMPVGVSGVNNDTIRQAQGDEGNKTVVRGVYSSRFTALMAHVTPAQPGPYGWTPNPFAAAAADQSGSTSLFSPSQVEVPTNAPAPDSPASSDAGVPYQMDGLPPDFPSGPQSHHWGTSVENRHASWLWGLKYHGYTLHQWMRYFAQFGLWEWSTLCSQTEAQGQMWTDVEWYEDFQQHFNSWSSLCWCLCFLQISPDKARRMISVQYFHGKRDRRDRSRGPEGGSSTCL